MQETKLATSANEPENAGRQPPQWGENERLNHMFNGSVEKDSLLHVPIPGRVD